MSGVAGHHKDIFRDDVVTKRVSGDSAMDAAAVARVVERLKAKLYSGPIQAAPWISHNWVRKKLLVKVT